MAEPNGDSNASMSNSVTDVEKTRPGSESTLTPRDKSAKKETMVSDEDAQKPPQEPSVHSVHTPNENSDDAVPNGSDTKSPDTDGAAPGGDSTAVPAGRVPSQTPSQAQKLGKSKIIIIMVALCVCGLSISVLSMRNDQYLTDNAVHIDAPLPSRSRYGRFLPLSISDKPGVVSFETNESP